MAGPDYAAGAATDREGGGALSPPLPVGPGDEAITAGRILAVLRHLRGFTQRQLAARSGLTRTAISDYENDRRPIPDASRHRLLAALGLPLRAWGDTVRHVEWLEWLAEEGASNSRRYESRRIAERAGRDLERILAELLDVLTESSR